MKNPKTKEPLNRKGIFGKNFVILLGCLVLLSCEHLPPQIIEFDTESFNREWAAWETQGLVNYSVDEKFHLFSTLGEVRIVVQDNVIIQKEALDEWTLLEVENHSNYAQMVFDAVKTISEIYAWVNSEYESALEKIEQHDLRGITIKFTYNKEFHYPEYVNISWEGWGKGDSGTPPTYIYLSEFMPLE
jgi:hypothetical protein